MLVVTYTSKMMLFMMRSMVEESTSLVLVLSMASRLILLWYRHCASVGPGIVTYYGDGSNLTGNSKNLITALSVFSQVELRLALESPRLTSQDPTRSQSWLVLIHQLVWPQLISHLVYHWVS